MPPLKFLRVDVLNSQMFRQDRSWRGLACLGAVSVLLALAFHLPACATPGTTIEPREVHEWLMRIHNAASQRNFQGTFVVSSPGSVSSARISHFYEGADQFERIEPLEGPARQVFRHNGIVHTVWPVERVTLVEQRDVLNSFPSLLLDGDDRITDFYDVQAQKGERVAGHDANVLMLKPRDEYRYSYRLWAERQSGLLLRVEILNALGEVLEVSAFSDVSIGVRSQPDIVLQPMRKLAGYRVIKPTLQPTALEVEGWELRKTVTGFRQLSCVRRPLEVLQAPDGKAATAASPQPIPAVQTIFSDGITYVSIFIEPFNAERHPRPVVTVVGATQTMMSRRGDFWVTVVGDVPVVTLRAFTTALDRRK
ncbi:MAG: MucB/RseB C-terminal domain-containing protein [Aquabacterium sp.]|nr:MucB/RseB C-terminal domain-containing protein [Aquabacterium sp.]